MADKKLEWKKKRKGSGVIHIAEGVSEAIVDNRGMGFDPGISWRGDKFNSIDAAKTAVEEYYSSQIDKNNS